MNDDLIRRAREYATQAHDRIDQRRRYSGQAYGVHLKAVADIVASVSDDAEMVAAAWLHDVVEDTPATIEDVEREFGHAVARLVDELTDISRPFDGNRAVRKAKDRAHLAGASPRAQTIKLADIIDNCDDICRADPHFGAVFLDEASLLLRVLSQGEPRLHKRAQRLFLKWRKTLSGGMTSASSRKLASLGPQQSQVIHLLIRRFRAGDLARPIRQRRQWAQSQIVAADASLVDVVGVLTRHSLCIVDDAGGELREVRREDFGSPVARMWLFGMLTALELDLTQLIRVTIPQALWLDKLSPERLASAQRLLAERHRRQQACDLLDCLQFGDKFSILTDSPELLGLTAFKSRRGARRVFGDLESLRNYLAHSQTIGEDVWPSIARLGLYLFEHFDEEHISAAPDEDL